MERFVLTDAQWARMERCCLGKPTAPGRSGIDNRLFVAAVLWIVRTGSPLGSRRRGSRPCGPDAQPCRAGRDLPALFGKWSSVYRRYRDRVRADVFARPFEACSDGPDMEHALVDATIVKVHRHGQGAKGGSGAGPCPLR